MYRNAARRALLAGLPLLLLVFCVWSRRGARAQESDAVRLGRQEVETRIDDRHSIAVTTVRQELINSSGQPQEGSCLLPISDDAALLRFQVTAPAPARGETPEGRGRLESAGRNSYRALVHRVPARARAQFELVYAEALTRRGRRRKYVYPIQEPEGDATPTGMSVRVAIDAAAPPQRPGSMSHPMSVRRSGPRSVLLSYDSAEPPDGRDLVVDYDVPATAEDTRARLAVFTPPDRDQDPYFLLTLPPPAALLHGSRAAERPVDIVFCMDISGSTRGRKLDAIREAVRDGLADLAPGDRFGAVAFDDDTRAFRREITQASPANIAQAMRWVNRLRPGGGSDPERGLTSALRVLETRNAAGRAAIVAVVVDSDDPANLASAAQDLSLEQRHIRLVALGALADSRLVNYRVRGERLHSGPAIALSRAALTYGPSLSGARFDPGVLNASYIYPPPERLPALPMSTPVLLMGRLNQAPPARGSVRLTGSLEGQVRSLQTDYVWQPLDPASPVPALWASRRVRRLRQLAGTERGDAAELQESAARVQREHHLVPAQGEQP